MTEPSITPSQLCDYLNELLEIDEGAILTLATTRVFCNGGIADHPTAQVVETKEKKYLIGLLGILNGMFPLYNKDGLGQIGLDHENTENGNINSKFKTMKQIFKEKNEFVKGEGEQNDD